MALLISLIKAPSSVVLSRKEFQLDKVGGRIGRSATNDWVLPDPEKFLSSLHCEIIYEAGNYYVEDKSTNGTFVNGSQQPLGKGNRHILNNGDTLDAGDYRFEIAIPAGLNSLSGLDVFNQQPAISNGFDLDSSFFGSQDNYASQSHAADPLNSMLGLSKYQSSNTLDTSSSFDVLNNPIELFEGHKEHSLDDLLGLAPASSIPEALHGTINDHSGLTDAYAWPASSIAQESKGSAVIPENWDDDFFGVSNTVNDNSADSHDVGGPVFSGFTTLEPIIDRRVAMDVVPNNDKCENKTEALGMDVNEINYQLKSDAVSLNSFKSCTDINTGMQNSGVVTTEIRPQQSSVDSALLSALELDVSRLSLEEQIEIGRTIGLAMREVLGGVLTVLRSRATIKNEFRMNVTTIQPVENNPLKFSVSVDDALENLFLKKSKAYKKPVDAFKEGFQEIAEHQLAMIAGIKSGYESMLDRFDPKKLENTVNIRSKGSIIPALQKAKYWESYEVFFEGIKDNRDISFQNLFGSDFVSAYEDQLRRAAASRKKEALQ